MSNPPFSRIHVIINPAAGHDEPILNTLNRVFHPAGVDWSVSLTHADGDATRHAQQAAADGVDLVVSYGGDGTVMEVAAGLREHDVPMGILPGGTGNAVAGELGIPRALADAAKLLCQPEHVVRPVDMGRAGDRYFVLRTSIGMQAALVERADRELKDRFGNLAYLMAALDSLSSADRAHYRLTIDGETVEGSGLSCLINNSGMVGGLEIKLAGTIDPGDGLLDVFILNDDFESVVSLAASVIEWQEMTAALQYWQGREITIETDPPQPVRIDGEPFGQTPVTVRVLPDAVRVVTPQSPAPWWLDLPLLRDLRARDADADSGQ